MAFTATTTRITNADKAIPDVVSAPLTIPEQIGNISVWFDASKGVTADVNGKVSLWQDQSGNGNNASQSTATNQPIAGSDANGSYVSIGGIGLTPGAGFVSFPVVSAANTTTYVLFNVTQDSSSWLADPVLGNGNLPCEIISDSGAGISFLTSSVQGTSAQNYSANNLKGLNISTIEIPSTGLGATTSVLNNTQVTTAITTTGTSNNNALTYESLGRNANAIECFVYEVVVFNVTLSTQQKADMHSYFTNKYSLGF